MNFSLKNRTRIIVLAVVLTVVVSGIGGCSNAGMNSLTETTSGAMSTDIPTQKEMVKDVTAVLSEDGTLTVTGRGIISKDILRKKEIPDREILAIEICEGITSIDAEVFSYCENVVRVRLSKSVTTIGTGAFSYCTNLSHIDVDKNNPCFCVEDDVLFSKDKTRLVYYPANTQREQYTIPTSVMTIGKYALCHAGLLKNITIPEGVVKIEDSAFESCISLTDITIPDSVTTIGKKVFWGCYQLTDIKVSADNPCFCAENGILFDKGRTKLICYPINRTEDKYTIPDSVTVVGENAFADCEHLTDIVISKNVRTIEESAFEWCKGLTDINIPSSVITIKEGAFRNCINLVHVTLSDGLTAIGTQAFENCSNLTDIHLPSSVTTIGESAFEWCENLTDITIPDGVTVIKENTFRYCSSLTTVIIPDSVTAIAENAFENCDNLSIHCSAGSYAEQYARENQIDCVVV